MFLKTSECQLMFHYLDLTSFENWLSKRFIHHRRGSAKSLTLKLVYFKPKVIIVNPCSESKLAGS